jgi:6-phosphogluconolactonase
MAVNTYSTVDELTEALSKAFQNRMARLNQSQKQINLAFSGGSTPGAFFDKLAADQQNPITRTDWRRIHLFWVDERCVPPTHPDSNYGMTRDHLLYALDLRDDQVHRIRGENDPASEAVRYAGEIRKAFNLTGGLPVFDWIFLGLGADGHTASIFPNNLELFHSEELMAVTRFPSSGQFRVTLTGPVVMQAKQVTFLVTGGSKSEIVRQIIGREPGAERYPAYQIQPVNCAADWYLDAPAAKQLNIQESD